MKQSAIDYLVNILLEESILNTEVLISKQFTIGNAIVTAKAIEKQQLEKINFVYWLMENCELIKDDETEENTLWRFDSEDYSVEGLHEHYINNVI